MEHIILRIINTVTIPSRSIVIAAVEVVNGKPTIGSRLTDSKREGVWEIVGFGHGQSPTQDSQRLLDLSLKPLEGNPNIADNLILTTP